MAVFIFHYCSLFNKQSLSVLQLFFFFLLLLFSVLRLDFLNIWRRLELLLDLSVCVRNSRERNTVKTTGQWERKRKRVVSHPSSGSQRSTSRPPPSPWWRTITHPSVTHDYHVTSHCCSRDLWPLPVLIQAADDVIPLLDDWQQAWHQLMFLMIVVGAPVLLWESHTHSQSTYSTQISSYTANCDVLLRLKQNSH